MKSRFGDGKCKDCQAKIDVGTEINKNNNDNWCPHGKNCQGAMQLNETRQAPAKNREIVNTEPTPEELLESARNLNSESNEAITEDNITELYNEAANAAVKQLIRQAAINNIMDKAGIKHPSRVAFLHEVMENLRD